MDVREKLIDLLIESKGLCTKNACGLCDYFRTHYCKSHLQANYLISNGVTVQEWISVKDRLPKNGEYVFTCKNGIVDIQVYEKNRNGWISDGWFWSMATVTHWMPIPQPPKGE